MPLGMTAAPTPESAQPQAGHLVLMYGGDRSLLIRGVADFLAQGLRRGERTVVIAGDAHRSGFVERLGLLDARPHGAIADGRLVILDAHETLARFMVDGQPDWALFEQS